MASSHVEGRELWTTGDPRREADGSLSVLIPSGFLGPREYTLELLKPGGRASPPLAVYDLDLRRQTTR